MYSICIGKNSDKEKIAYVGTCADIQPLGLYCITSHPGSSGPATRAASGSVIFTQLRAINPFTDHHDRQHNRLWFTTSTFAFNLLGVWVDSADGGAGAFAFTDDDSFNGSAVHSIDDATDPLLLFHQFAEGAFLAATVCLC